MMIKIKKIKLKMILFLRMVNYLIIIYKINKIQIKIKEMSSVIY